MKTMQLLFTVFALLGAAACTDAVLGWGDTEIHYARTEEPVFAERPFAYSAWRGERVNAEAVLWAPSGLEEVTVEAGALKSGKAVIPASAVKAQFVGYVIGDKLADGYNQCGKRNKEDWEPILEADLIGVSESVSLEAGTAQPIWVSVDVPRDAAAGTYCGLLKVKAKGATALSLPFELKVIDRELPPAREWPFHLDLWQNPYSVARVGGVELWSPEHFELLKPVMENLVRAGQKVITATIMDRPWNGQTEDPFGPMATKTLKADGSWSYDYSAFDKWVEFMMGLGIDSQINCYTMIPWALTFDYFDEAKGCTEHVQAAPGSKEYTAYWGIFIADFARHLREKGWFDKTMIAMDERSEESMKAAIALIKGIDPDFRIALAGSYHESIADSIDDLCIGFHSTFPEGVIEKRRSEGKLSTYYTCCSEAYPNTFIASSPADASWIPWGALALGVDGYLRWAFNSWTEDPEHDARFRSWAAGDCYMVYPEGRTGIRFEKLVEGLQDCEKARILREEWSSDPAHAEDLARLENAIGLFNYLEISENGSSPALKQAREAINL